jgi:hypothetical protein
MWTARDTSARIAARRPMRLPLPSFTYGLDIVLLVGRLRLLEHQAVDEIHQEVLRRLEKLRVTIARREIL